MMVFALVILDLKEHGSKFLLITHQVGEYTNVPDNDKRVTPNQMKKMDAYIKRALLECSFQNLSVINLHKIQQMARQPESRNYTTADKAFLLRLIAAYAPLGGNEWANVRHFFNQQSTGPSRAASSIRALFRRLRKLKKPTGKLIMM
ncbi:hypothetical protein MBANPS3_011034 [Mucor bainieri]